MLLRKRGTFGLFESFNVDEPGNKMRTLFHFKKKEKKFTVIGIFLHVYYLYEL